MQPIRIGIIGCGARGIGTFGRLLTRDFTDRARLVAVADSNTRRASASVEFLRTNADIYTDYADMLRRPDLDAVVITAPDHLHEKMCLDALREGKHVFVDKPLATSAAGCQRVVDAARQSGRLVYLGFNLRHHPVLLKMKALADEGALGRLFTMQIAEYYNGGRTFMSRWNRWKKLSGGLFVSKGTHDLDVINWFLKPARPVRVSCFGNVFVLNRSGLPFPVRDGVEPGPTCSACAYQLQCPDAVLPAPDARTIPAGWSLEEYHAYSRRFDAVAMQEDGYSKDLCMYLSEKDTHDQGVAAVEYDNGATALYSECFVTAITDRFYRLDGTAGHMEASFHGRKIDFRGRWDKNTITHELPDVPGGHGGSDPVMCADFLDCLTKGQTKDDLLMDGYWSVALGEACEISRAEKRTVEIHDLF